MIYLRTAIRDDAMWVSEHLRPDDAREVATAGDSTITTSEGVVRTYTSGFGTPHITLI